MYDILGFRMVSERDEQTMIGWMDKMMCTATIMNGQSGHKTRVEREKQTQKQRGSHIFIGMS